MPHFPWVLHQFRREALFCCVWCVVGVALKSIIHTRQSFGADVWIRLGFKLCIWDHFRNHSFHSPSDLFLQEAFKNCISMSKKVIRCFPPFLLVILKKTKVVFWCHRLTFQEKPPGKPTVWPIPPRGLHSFYVRGTDCVLGNWSQIGQCRGNPKGRLTKSQMWEILQWCRKLGMCCFSILLLYLEYLDIFVKKKQVRKRYVFFSKSSRIVGHMWTYEAPCPSHFAYYVKSMQSGLNRLLKTNLDP